MICRARQCSNSAQTSSPLWTPLRKSAWKQEPLRMELLDHCQTGPGPLEGFEEQTHRRLHLGVRIEDDTILRVVHKADGHHLFELPASGAAQDAAPQLCLEHMQFRFTHCALQAQ